MSVSVSLPTRATAAAGGGGDEPRKSLAIVVTGVSGAGKSTLGIRLATALNGTFIEGDRLHDAAAIAAMSAGRALTENDGALTLAAADPPERSCHGRRLARAGSVTNHRLSFAGRMGLLAAVLGLASAQAAPPTGLPIIALWPNGAPGPAAPDTRGEIFEDSYVRHVSRPSLTIMRADPAHANGAGVVVMPGGGHRMLVYVNEGLMPARTLNRFGVTAFVLKYRLARETGSPYSIERDAAADARRAIRWVRTHAAEYGVDPHRIGLMGFSAGGELVSLVADNPALTAPPPVDAIDAVSGRPDFQILIYPGPLGIPARAPAGAPPAFLAAGTLDACCATTALTLYQQLRAAGVSAELHLFADTDHAFNVAMHSERVSLQHWPDRLADWLADGGWLIPGPRRAVPSSWPPQPAVK